MSIAWLLLFFFQVAVSIFLFYTYYIERDKRKLIFGIGFLISSFTHIYQATTLKSLADENLILHNIYYWSVFPLLFAVSSAVHESLLPFNLNRRIDIIYFFSLATSFIIIVFSPFPAEEVYVYFTSIFALELIIVTIYVILKYQRQVDIYFFMSIILLGIGGISLSEGFDQSFSLLALFIGLLFIGFAFHSPKSKETGSSKGISQYFTLKKQLNTAKKTLNETEEKYRHIAESTSDLISLISFSLNPTFTYISPSHKRIMRYEEKDLIGKNALTLVHPEDKKKIISILKKYIFYKAKKFSKESLEKAEETFEFRVKDKQGKWHHLESKANAAGNQILLISRDITKRKETEQELVKTKAFLEASINQSSAGMLIADAPDVKIRYANPAALGIRGDKVENLTQISVEDHVKQWQTYYPNGMAYKPENLPLSRAILKGETVRDEEVIIRNKDGTDRHVLTNAAPVRNDKDEIIAGVVVFSDISELKKSQEKEKKHQRELIKLNKNTLEMLNLPTRDAMYDYIGTTLTKIIEDAIIIIGDFNEKQNQVTVKNLFGIEHQRLKHALSILKVNPIGKTYPLREDIKQLYTEQKIVEIKGGLSNLSKHEYPSFVIKKIKHFLHLKKVYTIGLRQQNQLFAWIHILKFNHSTLKKKELVETFLSQSSLILQRKFFEEKNKDLANIVTQSDEAIIQTNLNLEIIYMNPKAEQLFGYQLEEVINKNPEIFNAEKTAPEIQKHIHKTVSQGRTFSGVIRNKRKDGSIFWCQMKISALFNEHGTMYGYMSSQRDVTDKKTAEEEQKRLHKKSLFLSRTANELQRFSIEEDILDYIGIKIKELSGNCLVVLSSLDEETDEFRIKKSFGNPKILDRIHQFIGLNFTSFKSISGKEFVEQYLYADHLKRMTEEDFKNMVAPTLPKGSYVFAKKIFNINEIYIMGLKEEGVVHGSITIVAYKDSIVENTEVIETFLNQASVALQRNRAMKNLSEMNENLEEKVNKRTQEIHRLLKQKDEFVNQLGHDLKNPLGPLVNLLPIVEKHIETSKDKKMLQVAQRNVNYMKNLVQKTLELARLNSPNTTLTMNSVNLKNQVDDIIERNNLMFEEKNIIVSSHIPDHILVYADQLRLEELLNNLLNNAVKYNEENGKIEIDAFEKEDTITISIKDDGIGMNAEQINHIFDEFYKADESRHDFDSSGLGMSICKRIVEKHGGSIWAESDGLGKGSTFYFTLKASVSKNTIKGTDETRIQTPQHKSKESVSEKVDQLLSSK